MLKALARVWAHQPLKFMEQSQECWCGSWLDLMLNQLNKPFLAGAVPSFYRFQQVHFVEIAVRGLAFKGNSWTPMTCGSCAFLFGHFSQMLSTFYQPSVSLGQSMRSWNIFLRSGDPQVLLLLIFFLFIFSIYHLTWICNAQVLLFSRILAIRWNRHR